jgi:hypothetical protein
LQSLREFLPRETFAEPYGVDLRFVVHCVAAPSRALVRSRVRANAPNAQMERQTAVTLVIQWRNEVVKQRGR